jgi:hypothetical protein
VPAIVHLSFGEGALDAGVVELSEELVSRLDFGESYSMWLKVFEEGSDPRFDCSVAESIGAVESSIEK